MIRVVIYLILVGAAAYGVARFADVPGDVVVTWQGLRIETSLMVMGVGLLSAALFLRRPVEAEATSGKEKALRS